ncbi:hypothetical protein [Sediminibacterium ginsengisoli]|uniref:Uncharacterized protein n=1 Tax=Sediminibacterium ginsengisoli TaxID=413434 RepID=A0A1T4R7X0_9BACT|nr:hypothetical protein [Sediminibacterium ginsengisoli]SKA12029.1 hypothetical protein SAMN04488132_1119 [Sediminibacterium ginsengisoli]
MADLKDILNHDEALDNEILMRYLNGTASEEERFAIENQMAGSAFMDDAVEGLQHFSDKNQLKNYADQLNRQLHKQTATAVQRKKLKGRLKSQQWAIITLLAIITLCILGYIVIRMYYHQQ